jgi:hypothetical protein
MIDRRYKNEYGLRIPPVKSTRTVTNDKSQMTCRFVRNWVNRSFLRKISDIIEKTKENAINLMTPG